MKKRRLLRRNNNDYNKDESIGNQTAQYFYDKYYIYSLVLDELIKVGEVDE